MCSTSLSHSSAPFFVEGLFFVELQACETSFAARPSRTWLTREGASPPFPFCSARSLSITRLA